MTLRILDLAEADLLRGFRFYQRKSRGVGWYFLDSLSAEIESLHLYAGSAPQVSRVLPDVVPALLAFGL